MPSPFPGVDPYLEGQRWSDFHVSLLVYLSRTLTPLIAPDYVAEIEESASARVSEGVPVAADPGTGVRLPGTLDPPCPEPLTMLRGEPVRHRRIAITSRVSGKRVTVIELLRPSYKRPFGMDQLRYGKRREALLESRVHLVEIDLLRGGMRMPFEDGTPPGDYYVLTSREELRPRCAVQPFGLRDPLPVFPVPLLHEDEDVTVNLGAIFSELYDDAGYARALDYTREPEPPLSPVDREWARQLLPVRP